MEKVETAGKMNFDHNDRTKGNGVEGSRKSNRNRATAQMKRFVEQHDEGAVREKPVEHPGEHPSHPSQQNSL